MPKKRRKKQGPKRQTAGAVFGSDPLKGLQSETQVLIHSALFWTYDATQSSQGIGDWDQFKGGLLALCVVRDHETVVVGSAVCIAPGLAVTASHVLRDSLERLVAGVEVLVCFGPRNGELDLWQVTQIAHAEADDIAYINIQMRTPITPSWQFTTFKIRTRPPEIGEFLTVFGFRFPETFTGTKNGERKKPLSGELRVSRGPVEAFYPQSRDSVLMNFPCIQIGCETPGGVSGGAVLDDSGCLIGILSSSYETTERTGPSMASWLLPTMDRVVDIDWPPGMYSGKTRVIDIRKDLLNLVE